MSYINHTDFAPAMGIQELSIDEVDVVDGAGRVERVGQGFTLAAIGTVAVGVGLAVPTGGGSLVAVGAFLTGGGFWLASH